MFCFLICDIYALGYKDICINTYALGYKDIVVGINIVKDCFDICFFYIFFI